MAIQFPDFLNAKLIKPDFSGITDIPENFVAGYKATLAPEQMRIEQQKAREQQRNMEMANQLKQMEVQHKPTEYGFSDQKSQLELDQLKNPEKFNKLGLLLKSLHGTNDPYEQQVFKDAIVKESQNKSGIYGTSAPPKFPGSPAQQALQTAKWYEQKGDPNAKTYYEMAELEYKKQQESVQRKQILNTPLQNMTTDEKNYVYGMARAAGITADELQEEYRKGGNVRSVIEKRGLNFDNISPQWTSKNELQKQIIENEGNAAAMEGLNDFVTDAISLYPGSTMGLSTPLIYAQLKNKGADDYNIGKFFAGRYMGDELSMNRGKLGGLKNMGIEALTRMTKDAHTRAQGLSSTLNANQIKIMNTLIELQQQKLLLERDKAMAEAQKPGFQRKADARLKAIDKKIDAYKKAHGDLGGGIKEEMQTADRSPESYIESLRDALGKQQRQQSGGFNLDDYEVGG